MLGLTRLNADFAGIANISGIEHCVDLTYLNLAFNQIVDVSLLAALASLTDLDLWHNQIRDVSPLASLTSLTRLTLYENNIADLSPLTGLANLWDLELSNNRIADLSPLTGLTNLWDLDLSRNRIADVSPLTGLTSLYVLDLSNNWIADVSPLLANAGLGAGDHIDLSDNRLSTQDCLDLRILQGRGASVVHDPCYVTFPDPHLESVICKVVSKPPGYVLGSDLLGLTRLDAHGAGITNLSGIQYAVNLTKLQLSDNQIIDVSALAALTGLTDLNLSHNQIIDVSPLTALTSLTRLLLSENQIVNLSTLPALTGLTELSLYDNQIVDVSPLAGLAVLGWLELFDNQIVDVSPLAALTSLWGLDLHHNQIIDVNSLLPNAGLDAGDWISLKGNPMSVQACTDIGILELRGVTVDHDPCFAFVETPHSGQYQQGHPLSMKVAFNGTVGTPQIQWTKNGVDIPGETSDTYSKNPLTVDDTGAYRVRVTDDAKTVYISPPAIITVTEGSPLPLAAPLTLFLSLAGIALAGTLVLRRMRKRPAVVEDE